MNKRGRKTAGELAAVDATQRPGPPRGMPKDQKDTWQRCVDGLPVEWFRPETLDLLREYCEQIAMSQKISKLLLKLPDGTDSTEMSRWVQMKEKSGRMVMSLATKMRLSQQSSYDKSKAKGGASPSSDPWRTAS